MDAIKPSNLLFVTCPHATELFKYTRSKDNLRNLMFASTNSRLLFLGIFLEKLEDENATHTILQSSCKSTHKFKTFAKQISVTMFNLFAVNMTKEVNNKIHQQRKRTGTSDETEKRDKTSMKAKKLKS